MPAVPIENLARELLANHNLLAALAGPAIAVKVDVGVRPTGAADRRGPDAGAGEPGEECRRSDAKRGAYPNRAGELPADEGATEALQLTIEDSGPGIPAEALEEIFAVGVYDAGKGAAPEGKLAGDPSRTGAGDYTLDRGSGWRPAAHQPGARRGALRNRAAGANDIRP